MSLFDKRPKPVSGFTIEELDGELLLFHPLSQKILRTNKTGALVWQLCDGTRTVNELAALLAAAFPDGGDGLRADVAEIVQAFVAHGALSLV
ncbi:MAG: hypothetical protein Kow0080_19290 [Candidatus Promineifilaceae bacterium]